MTRPIALTPFVVIALLGAACGGSTTAPDPNPSCNGSTRQVTASNTGHVDIGTPVTYSSVPPAIGQHWSSVAAGGVYVTPVSPELYVHDLEHGAIVFLYDCPSGCASTVTALEQFARARPDDAGGDFRWILAPYPGLPTEIAVVAWGWIYSADCVDTFEIDLFVDAHYRRAPEDFPIP